MLKRGTKFEEEDENAFNLETASFGAIAKMLAKNKDKKLMELEEEEKR